MHGLHRTSDEHKDSYIDITVFISHTEKIRYRYR